MSKVKHFLDSRLIPKKILEANKTSIENIEFYRKVDDIIERTKIAMGRKTELKTNTGSTLNSKINTNAISSTQQI